MRYFDIGGTVSAEEALTVPCPLCLVPAGQPCVYIADHPENSTISWRRNGEELRFRHRKGEPTAKHHNPRSAAVRERRYKQWKHEQVDRRPVDPVSERARQVRAAMLAWDAAEYAALTAWWREHGHIIVNADRTRP